MNSAPNPEYDALPSTAAGRVDQVCHRFEDAWQAGQEPRLEDYLTQVPESDRPALRAELALLERHYRQRAAGTPAASSDTATVDQPHAPLLHVPATVGKYRVVERLGGGGQADVFRAVHPELGHDVVLKLARADLPPEQRRRLLDEGRVLARLDDPGTVRVHDVGDEGGRPFLVFARVAGRSLADAVRRDRLAPRAAAALVADLAATLDRVHKQGVLHRDLKPANVLLDASGRPLLMDFGLASLEQPWERVNVPDDGLCGTFSYMAPEQALGLAERIGPRTDLFGLGAILYELLTGRPPYRGRDSLDVFQQALAGRVLPPRQVEPRVPRALERVCLRRSPPTRRSATPRPRRWSATCAPTCGGRACSSSPGWRSPPSPSWPRCCCRRRAAARSRLTGNRPQCPSPVS
jgi:serine/threonine-protein kinase